MSIFEDRPKLPMPPDNEYAIHQWNFFRYVWDVRGVPEVQEFEDVTIVTPQLGRLMIYGRLVKSPYPEDRRGEEEMRERGKVLGEWFSLACPIGEMGFVALSICEQIDAAEFSAAYQRGWTDLSEDPA